MSPRTIETGVLSALLILRIVLGPITARPDAPHASNGPQVVRKCSWPVQRPTRMAPTSTSQPNLFGLVRSPMFDPTRGHPARLLDAMNLSRCSRLGSISLRNWSALRLIDSPRC